MKKLVTILIALSMLSICASSSKAAFVFFDDFESYGLTLNWTGEGGWAVSNGYVDMIGEGGPYDLLPAGNGHYLDMDGSGADAGMISYASINLAAGDYVVSFDIAGNHRGKYDDSMRVVVTGLVDETILGISESMPMTTMTIPFTVTSATTVTLSFEGIGGDNIGNLLDNVGIDDGTNNVVPAPGAALLGSFGIGIVGWLRRRRSL